LIDFIRAHERWLMWQDRGHQRASRGSVQAATLDQLIDKLGGATRGRLGPLRPESPFRIAKRFFHRRTETLKTADPAGTGEGGAFRNQLFCALKSLLTEMEKSGLLALAMNS
jgi:hypothetical protein